MSSNKLHIFQVGNVLVSPDIITENFCCNINKCKGSCCVEGDSGAPVTQEEVLEIENCLKEVWNDLSPRAQDVINRQGVACVDSEGDLVTSIVDGKDCVFTCYENGICLCSLERAFREKRTRFCKPISCALYPIRVKKFPNGLFGINYNRWDICKHAVRKGNKLQTPIYQFLKEPLTRRFGKAWYEELCEVAKLLKSQSLP